MAAATRGEWSHPADILRGCRGERRAGQGDAAPSPTLRSQHVEATRRAVLAAARASFGSKGYAQTSVDEIAAAARVTKGAVYHHFAGKEALFRDVWAEVEAEATTRAAGAADPDAPPIDQMVAVVNAYLDVALDEEVRRITLIDGPAVLGLEPEGPVEQHPGHVALRAFIAAAIDRGELRDLDPGVCCAPCRRAGAPGRPDDRARRRSPRPRERRSTRRSR